MKLLYLKTTVPLNYNVMLAPGVRPITSKPPSSQDHSKQENVLKITEDYLSSSEDDENDSLVLVNDPHPQLHFQHDHGEEMELTEFPVANEDITHRESMICNNKPNPL